MPDASLADKITRWKTLTDAVAPRLEEVPHLSDEHTDLRSAVQLIEALKVDEDLHTARLRTATERRRETEARCTDLAARITTGLQSHFGKRSQELRQFAIEPLSRQRRKKEEAPPATPAPTTPPAAAGPPMISSSAPAALQLFL